MFKNDDERWRAESDAHALARAEEIKADKLRLERAKQVANEMLEEREKEIMGLRRLANRGGARPHRDNNRTRHPYGVFHK